MSAATVPTATGDSPAGDPRELFELPIHLIKPSSTNPREEFDDIGLQELAASIEHYGVLQPILVRRRVSTDGYELVAGERRWRASRLAGRTTIPAIVRDIDDAEVLGIQIVENLQRENVHPIDEAIGFQRLIAEARLEVMDIASRVGRSKEYVYGRLKLLALSEELQRIFRAGRITPGHAILLARLSPADQQRASEAEGALWRPEGGLFDPLQENDDGDRRVAVSVRELAGWIDQNVRADFQAPEFPDLFPEAAAAIDRASEQEEKIQPITFEHYVRPEARSDQRTLGPRSWVPADGTHGKECEHSILGVVVVGPRRGDAFRVCIDKKRCKVHYAKEQRAAAQIARAKAAGQSGTLAALAKKEQARQERMNAERNAWEDAVPALLGALATRLKSLAVIGDGVIGKVLMDSAIVEDVDSNPFRGAKSADDLIRLVVFDSFQACTDWWNHERFERRAMVLGVDVPAILQKQKKKNARTPLQTSATEADPPAPKPARKKSPAAAKKAAARTTTTAASKKRTAKKGGRR